MWAQARPPRAAMEVTVSSDNAADIVHTYEFNTKLVAPRLPGAQFGQPPWDFGQIIFQVPANFVNPTVEIRFINDGNIGDGGSVVRTSMCVDNVSLFEAKVIPQRFSIANSPNLANIPNVTMPSTSMTASAPTNWQTLGSQQGIGLEAGRFYTVSARMAPSATFVTSNSFHIRQAPRAMNAAFADARITLNSGNTPITTINMLNTETKSNEQELRAIIFVPQGIDNPNLNLEIRHLNRATNSLDIYDIEVRQIELIQEITIIQDDNDITYDTPIYGDITIEIDGSSFGNENDLLKVAVIYKDIDIVAEIHLLSEITDVYIPQGAKFSIFVWDINLKPYRLWHFNFEN